MAAVSDFCSQLGFPKAHRKITLTDKGERGLGCGLGKPPNVWSFHLIFLQWLNFATINLVHSLGLPIRLIIKITPNDKSGRRGVVLG